MTPLTCRSAHLLASSTLKGRTELLLCPNLSFSVSLTSLCSNCSLLHFYISVSCRLSSSGFPFFRTQTGFSQCSPHTTSFFLLLLFLFVLPFNTIQGSFFIYVLAAHPETCMICGWKWTFHSSDLNFSRL